jgi:hypothetical protein
MPVFWIAAGELDCGESLLSGIFHMLILGVMERLVAYFLLTHYYNSNNILKFDSIFGHAPYF